jgi:hypothetical protein
VSSFFAVSPSLLLPSFFAIALLVVAVAFLVVAVAFLVVAVAFLVVAVAFLVVIPEGDLLLLLSLLLPSS